VQLPPDLPDQTFKNFGREAEYLAAAWFVSRGFRVIMSGGSLPHDLIVDNGRELQRVQVKSTVATPDDDGKVVVKVSRLTA
jgi:Holliday junction resolvase-like predicted endonuclease